jgi:uncharacterized protein (TIGR02145 family)
MKKVLFSIFVLMLISCSYLIANTIIQIPLSQGWNLISSYITIQEPDSVQYVFADIQENLVIVKNNNGDVYIPSYDINIIGKWEITQGYQVYMTNADTLVISGEVVNPAETLIILNQGWNMISYLRDTELDCETVFAGLTNDENLVIVKDNEGNVYIPSYDINTIGNLVPGQGYQIYVINADTLIYKTAYPPEINSINPTIAKTGDEVIVAGTGFGSTQGISTVTFNGTIAVNYTSWNGTLIKVKVPTNATSGKVSVTVNGQKSNEIDFIIDNTETVTIGTQVWTLKNLDVSTYRNGDVIPQVTDPNVWKTLTTGAWCYYKNDASNNATYGKLYNWYAVKDTRGLAPSGYHVPSDAEWTTLTTYLGGESVAGGKIKETGTVHWISPNTGAINSSGFTGLPGGWRYDGGYINIRFDGIWWSSTEYDGTKAYRMFLTYNYAGTYRGGYSKVSGYSVRCARD